jgi:cell division protein FtsN
VLGLIVGLVVAAAVALYVTRAPSPFVAKNGQPPTVAPAANEDTQFDPNRMLQGNAASQPVAASQPAPGAVSPPAPGVLNGEPQIVEVPPAARRGNAGNKANGGERNSAPTANGNDNSNSNSNSSNSSNNNSSSNGSGNQPAAAPRHTHTKTAEPSRTTSTSAQEKPVPPARPAEPARPARTSESVSAVPTTLGRGYFVQAGSYSTQANAEQQRARLGLQGFETKIVRLEASNGETKYRVRVGPFTKPEDMYATRQRLADAGVDTSLVQVVKGKSPY